MKSKLEQAVALIRQNRIKRRRTAALLLALSCFVSANVFWSLRDIGTALTGGALCGKEEHVHTAECYETLPAAGPDADAQTDICTDPDENPETRLICEKEEHTHTAACIPSVTADIETAADWEATLPDCSADSLREQLARTAESQLGYTESERNFAVADGQRCCYSRYGQWYGNPYGNWNPLFVYFCLYYAGVPEDRIPGRGGCWAWSLKLEEEGLIRNTENGTPVRGDILLLDLDLDSKTDRIGIVTLIQNSDEGLLITIAEGACEGAADERCYLWNSPYIIGFVSPEDPETLPALEYSVASDSLITVRASAEADVFPAGTVMSVTDIGEEEALQIAADAADEDEQIRSAFAVDISFRDPDGSELEPADGQTVSVCISLPENVRFTGDTLRLLHLNDDGTLEVIPDAVFTEDSVTFDAEAFSIYLVSGGSEQLVVVDDYTVGDEYYNTPEHPYTMKVGETIHVKGYSNSGNYLDPADKSVIAKAGEPNEWNAEEVYINGERMLKTESDFIAKNAGLTAIVLQYTNAEGQTDYKHFYINVEESPDSILVQSHFEPDGKGFNHIKEALVYGGIQTADVEGYIPNGPPGCGNELAEPYTLLPGSTVTLFPLQEDGVTADTLEIRECLCLNADYYNNEYNPFVMKVGQKIILTGVSNSDNCYVYSENENIVGRTGNPDEWDRNGWYYNYNTSPNKFITEKEFEARQPGVVRISIDTGGNNYRNLYIRVVDVNDPTPATKIYENTACSDTTHTGAQTLEGLNPGQIRVRNKLTGETMYINVPGSYIGLTHADMEIADDGKYTTTFPSYDEDGNPVTTVRVYRAYVDYVNDSWVYTSEQTGNVEQAHFSSNNGQYQQIGEIGSTQYEYTSAFNSQVSWNGLETDHAKFNVNMTLVPNYEYTIKSDGTETPHVPLDNSQENWVHFTNLEFNLNKQDVIDALNKCPFTNGLDFTLQADVTNLISSHVVHPELTKIFENGELEDQQFEFEITEVDTVYDYTFKCQWNPNEPIGKYDSEFSRIPADYVFDSAFQIVKRVSQDSYEFVWGKDVDGNRLQAALLAHEGFRLHNISTPNEVFNFMNEAMNNPDGYQEGITEFIKIVKDCIVDSTEIEVGDWHYRIPEAGQYLFRFKGPGYHDTERNDANGHVDFDRLEFHQEGTYIFKVREVIPDAADWNLIDYDTHETTVMIQVTRNENGEFTKEITLLDENGQEDVNGLLFSNKYRQYILPATGGTGVLPYLFAGTGFIALSILLIYRRRKEVFDSR